MDIETKPRPLDILDNPSYIFSLTPLEKKETPASFSRYAMIAVVLVFLFRAFLTYKIPLLGDEAYYWL